MGAPSNWPAVSRRDDPKNNMRVRAEGKTEKKDPEAREKTSVAFSDAKSTADQLAAMRASSTADNIPIRSTGRLVRQCNHCQLLYTSFHTCCALNSSALTNTGIRK